MRAPPARGLTLLSKIKGILEQIHHRSLWQILVAYSLASWAVVGGVGTLMDVLGLPDWVPPAVAVLLVAALPLVLVIVLNFVFTGLRSPREGIWEKYFSARKETSTGSTAPTTTRVARFGAYMAL